MTDEEEIVAILDGEGPNDEPESKLWADLYTWAFSQDPEIPSSDEMTAAEAQRLLDKAAAEVEGLKTAEEWRSAARYFQAENFHGLERPACARAIALAKGCSHERETVDPTSSAPPAIEPGAADRPAPPLDAALDAAKKVLGSRAIEAVVNDVGVVELYLVVHAVTTPRDPDEIAIDQVRAKGLEADEGDELLFPFYYLRDDEEMASDQRRSGIATLLKIPSDAFDAMQRELASRIPTTS
jgi:hypothetical protein